MLRLAFVRPSCASPIWRRFNTNGPVILAPTSNETPAKAATPASTRVDPQLSAFSADDDPLYHDLEQELSGITEADLSSSIKTPAKLAETESELFGTPSRDEWTSDILDPNKLPRRVLLDARYGEFSEAEYASTLVHGRAIHTPFFHPRTHDIPAANIQLRSHHPRLLDLFTHFATHAAYSLGIPVSRPYYLPTKRTLWTVPRSPFAHKKSQENFERRVHKRAIKAWDTDPEVVDRWFKYLRRHAMGGVGMRMTKWERLPLGIGETRLAHVMDRLQNPVPLDSEKIKALGEKIVMEEMTAVEMPATVAPHKK